MAKNLRDKLISVGAAPILEERIRRDFAFADWIEQHDDGSDPLVTELRRSLTMHRIAASNLMMEIDTRYKNGAK